MSNEQPRYEEYYRTLPGGRTFVIERGREHRGTGHTFVFLHGAGGASSERMTPVCADLAAAGHHAVAFDAFGHGRSDGHLKTQSLLSRTRQAVDVLGLLGDVPVTLVGFSMGAQVACGLLHQSPVPVAAVALCAPAAYADDAMTLSFGDGFTQRIRQDRSWASSSAFTWLKDFTGPALLCLAGQDTVIPAGVITRYREALFCRDRGLFLTFPTAAHQLGSLVSTDVEARGRLVSALLSLHDEL